MRLEFLRLRVQAAQAAFLAAFAELEADPLNRALRKRALAASARHSDAARRLRRTIARGVKKVMAKAMGSETF